MLIEQVVQDYLTNELGNIGVYPENPKPLPDKYVTFRIMDREKRNHINGVTFEFSSLASSKFEAAQLDELVRDAMENIIVIYDISCHFGGGNDDMDTSINKYRYRCYFNLFY